METVQEEWRPVNGDFSGWPYEVSNSGGVRSVRANKKLATFLTNVGYPRVALCFRGNSKRVLVHRLVLCAFGSPPDPGAQCNHKDGNKCNNDHGNLEWVTCSGNMRHAFETGIHGAGGRKLSNDQVLELRANPPAFSDIPKVADSYGVGVMTITRLLAGKTYRKVI